MAGERPSLRRRKSPSAADDDTRPDVFDDRNMVDDVESDNTSSLEAASLSHQPSFSSLTTDRTPPSDPPYHAPLQSTRAPARDSIRKSRSYFESPFDSHEDQYPTGPSHTLSAPFRGEPDSYSLYNDSASDDGEFAETHSPLTSGPSHNYGQFSQSSALAPLTPSSTGPSVLVPQSTGRQSLHGPAHPYAMYPQNVDDDLDDMASQAGDQQTSQRLPVGFPRSTPHVRIDMDHIVEQLPPYSEYPEGGAPLHIAVPPRIVEVAPSTSASSLHTVLRTSRPPQSMSDNPESPESRSLLEETTTNSSSEVGLLSNRKKLWHEKSWKEKRKTKFCGISFGWIVLVSGVLLFIAIVLSSVIGGFFTVQARLRRQFTAQTLWDAEQLFNASMTPLTTGTYQVPLGPAQQTENECITNSSQTMSWSCGMTSESGGVALKIADAGQNGNGQNQIASIIKYGMPGFVYGTEVPQTIPSQLRLVKDIDLPQYGPAWQFQTIFTKIVVTWPDAFYPAYVANGVPAPSPAPPAPHAKRNWMPIAQVGDQPWMCYWNHTLLEGFIYIDQNSTAFYNNNNSNTTPIEEQGKSNSSAATPKGNDVDLSHDKTMADPLQNGAKTAAPTPTPAAPTPTPAAGSAGPAWTSLPYYPQLIKLEERRIPGNTVQPYCQKVQIMADGSASVLMDRSGNPYQVEIDETNPAVAAYTSAYGSVKAKRTTVSGDCHCQWMSGQN